MMKNAPRFLENVKIRSAASRTLSLELVLVLVERGRHLLETLPLPDVQDEGVRLALRLQRVRKHELPVVEDALREGLSSGLGTQLRVESEGLNDGQIRLQVEDRGSRALNGLKHLTTLLVQHVVDTSNGGLRALNLDQVDRLHELGLGGELGGVHGPTAGRDDLTSSTVDGIGVENDIADLIDGSTHVLLGEHSLLGGPLEGGNARVLDLVEVLDSLGDVAHQVGASGVRAEAPDLLGHVLVPSKLLRHNLSADLRVITRPNLSVIDGLGEPLLHRPGLEVDTVVLVRRLGHDGVVGLRADGLTERDDRRGHPDRRSSHEIVLEILQANLQVELSGAGDNVLAGLLNVALDHGVGLGQPLESLHQLGQVGGLLGLDGDTDDRGHGELHGLDGESILVLLLGKGGVLGDELVESDEGHRVSARHVLDGVLPPSHAQHGTLDGLDEQVLLGSRNVVGSHDTHLLSGGDLSGEDTAEGVETSLIGCGNHLGDVHHHRSVRIAVPDTGGVDIIQRSLVQDVHTVLLGHRRGRQMPDHHLQQGLMCREEGLHHTLHERLSDEILVLGLELGGHLELVKEAKQLVPVVVHGGVDDGPDRLVDELAEPTLAAGSPGVLLGPLLGGRVKEVVSPQLLHHLLAVSSELLGVEVGEHGEGESPSVESGREADRSGLRVHLGVTERLVGVGGHDDVGVLNDTPEGRECVLRVEHQLQEATVDLVDGQHGLDTLSQSLTEHRLGLHAHTLNAINHHESSVGDTERGSHLGREVDVTRGVDQVDQEVRSVAVLGESVELLLLHDVVQRNPSGLDGNSTLLLVGTGVGQTLVTGRLDCDDTGGGDQGIRQGGLSVIDMRNDGHVPDIVLLVHQGPDLVDRKLHHGCSLIEVCWRSKLKK
mmetsp:Transcript_5199/g.14877  ORF Transcript_5199/g.14877 Transcript_5199/m.14877 type:complete len:885 (-) Transcript_5199:8-2662(-)